MAVCAAGHENPPGQRFCGRCGLPLAASMESPPARGGRSVVFAALLALAIGGAGVAFFLAGAPAGGLEARVTDVRVDPATTTLVVEVVNNRREALSVTCDLFADGDPIRTLIGIERQLLLEQETRSFTAVVDNQGWSPGGRLPDFTATCERV